MPFLSRQQVASNEAALRQSEAERALKQASEEADLRQKASTRANQAEERIDELSGLLAGLQAQSATKLREQQALHSAALKAQAEQESARLAAAESENARQAAVLEASKLQGESALVRKLCVFPSFDFHFFSFAFCNFSPSLRPLDFIRCLYFIALIFFHVNALCVCGCA
jgi:hypothetical protein